MSAHSNPLRTLGRYRALRWLFVAGTLSDVGTWMQAVTVGALVAETSRSAAATALVMSVLFLPQGICSPFGGILADRFDRRRMAILTLAVQTLLTFVLAALVAQGVRSPLALSGVILLQGCAGALVNPALQAITPQLVSRDDLLPALSLGSISWNSGRILGPVLGAVCTAAWGPAMAITINAASFIVPIAALGAIRRRFAGGGHVELSRFVGELRDAARLAAQLPSMRVLLPGVVLVQLMLSALLPSIPFYGRDVLGGGTAVVTMLFIALGSAAMLAAAFLPSLTLGMGRSSVMRIFLGCLSVGTAIAGVARTPFVAAVGVAVFGCGITGFFVSSGTVVQRDAPESHRGRLVAIYAAITGLTYGLGAPLNGWIADRTWGLRTHLVLWAVVLAGAAFAAQRRRPDWFAALDGADPEPRWRRTAVLAEA